MLEQVKASLRAEGVKGVLEIYKDSLYWRTTISINQDKPIRRRVPLELRGEHRAGKAAERIRRLAQENEENGFISKPFFWSRGAESGAESGGRDVLTMAEAKKVFVENFWHGKSHSISGQMTLKRCLNELNRIDDRTAVTLEVLEATIKAMPDNSRSRLECWKQYKRLARMLHLKPEVGDLDQFFDRFAQSYETKKEMRPPNEKEALQILKTIRWDEEFGWLTAALLIYGCRPSEAFSLVPRGDGTAASVYTIKQKQKMPVLRTAMALRPEWATQFEMTKVERFYQWDLTSFDPSVAKAHGDRWRVWFSKYFDLTLYDLRHSWAIRSIGMLGNPVLAAKCMGHSLTVHSNTYHRWMQEDEVERAVNKILRDNEDAMPTR